MQLTYGNIMCNRGYFAAWEASRISACTAANGSGSQVVVDCMVSFMGSSPDYCGRPTVVALGCTALTSTTLGSRQVRFTLVA